MMNSMGTRFALMSLIALGFASCDIQDSPHRTSVSIAPRFSAEQALPRTIWVHARLRSVSGVDTTRTVAYARGGQITLGTLPAGTEFSIEMTGYDTSSGGLLATWWTRTSDTAGSAPVRTVALPAIQTAGSPADSLVEGKRAFQGGTLRFPAGTWITFDQSDPRSSGSATLAPTTFPVDSHPGARTARKIDGDESSGRPILWSEVVDFTFPIDPLDTLTSLDTLHLTTLDHFNDTTDFGAEENAVYQSAHEAGVLFRVDTLGRTIGSNNLNDPSLQVYATPTSQRAIVSIGGQSIPRGAFTQVPFPIDSLLIVKVENHGRMRNYTVRFVTTPGLGPTVRKNLDSLTSSTPGLSRIDRVDIDFLAVLPSGQDSIVLYPTPSPGFLAWIGDTLLSVGDSVIARLTGDSTTITVRIVTDRTDPKPIEYRLRLRRASSLAFRDTTWGVPWRDVPYDTLIQGTRKYRTLVVDGVRWMAENLNQRRDSSWCPALATDSCSKYGRLYSWSAAMDTTPRFDSVNIGVAAHAQGVCPVGWHLPSVSEWNTLFARLGPEKASTMLRSTGASWTLGGGFDSLGFRALPSGKRMRSAGGASAQTGRGISTWFWTSTGSGSSGSQATAIHLSDASGIAMASTLEPKENGYSVRCVEDAAP